MTIDEAINFFGSGYKVCMALNLKPQNLTKWRKTGYIPWICQYRLAEITEGELLPDEEDPRYAGRPPVIRRPRKNTDDTN